MKPEILLEKCQSVIETTPREFDPTLVLSIPRAHTGDRVRLYGNRGPIGDVIDHDGENLLVQFDIHKVITWLKVWFECAKDTV